MKIITDHAVYVQKDDIAFFNRMDLVIPASIFMKAFGSGIVDGSNRYEFVKFESPKEIEFFQGIDWMIDYNAVKDLSEEETITLGQSIAEEKNGIARSFNSMSPEEREQNMDMVSQWEFLDFKMYSLRNVLWFKQGKIKMKLPKGVDLPSEPVQETGIKKFMKTIFGKKN